VVAVVQARTGSSRLPGKVLADIGGQTVLGLLLGRLGSASEVQEVVVATSDQAADDAVATVAAAADVPVLRGPLDDVLERYRLAGERHGADAVVRVTGDCPLIDPAVVDAVVARWRRGGEQYVANIIEPRTFPDGMDTEVIAWPTLVDAAAAATDPSDREHVTPFIRAHPERYPQAGVYLRPACGELRVTLDTAQDLEQLRDLVRRLGTSVGLLEIMQALGQPARALQVLDSP
jgi:spore coat polysaccharide biosynthesis protein SpsF (cytidylyltransferase family)